MGADEDAAGGPDREPTPLEKYGFDPVVCEETAREDFERMCKARFIELGPKHSLLDKLGVMSREAIVGAIMRGWVTIGDDTAVVFKPAFSDKFFEQGAPTLTFGDVTGALWMEVDGLAPGSMARDFRAAAHLTKQPLATFKKLHNRDCSTVAALLTVFLG